jgi:DNA-binding HxlR family transcriptional regulator
MSSTHFKQKSTHELSILEKKKPRTIGVLGKAFVIEILEALRERPMRFMDLREHCPNDRTRANRLKGLKKNNFIKTVIIEIKEQSFIHYAITEKGEKAFELLQQLEVITTP